MSRMEEDGSTFKTLTCKPTRKRPLGEPTVDERTILERILKNWVSIRGNRIIWLIGDH